MIRQLGDFHNLQLTSEEDTANADSDLGHHIATRGKHEGFRVPNT
jgi:hypothetical protein